MSIDFKRGDTFKLPGLIFWQNKTDSIRYPLIGVTIRSQLRKGSILVATLTSVITDAANGEFYLHFVGSTESWPVGELTTDIEFTTSEGTIMSTRTFTVNCIKDETHNG